jgi:hypothetical protein
MQQSEQQPQQRGLSATTGADNGSRFASKEVMRHRLQALPALERFADVLDG